jgi:uncharacterized protein
MLFEDLHTQIIAAMKAGDQLRVSTLKLLLSEIKNYQIDHPQMTHEEEMTIVKKEAKKRKDSILAYQNAGRAELADKEQAELVILQEFMPDEMGEEELSAIVDQVIAEAKPQGLQEMGKIIGIVMQKAQGRADGSMVATLIKQKLS